MTKFEFREKLIPIGHHARILWTGVKYMIGGTITIGLLFAAVIGFCLVTRDGGYAAVIDFLISCFLLSVAVAGLYFMGLFGKRRGGHYVEK